MTEMQAFELLKKYGGLGDAQVVLRGILGEEKPNKNKRARLSWRTACTVRRAARALSRCVPVAKIIGKKWFYGIEFQTNKHTLDPRPDSETLVDAVLTQMNAYADIRILDMGTGTGCLVGAIAKDVPSVSGVGIDKSRRALRVARRNMKGLGLLARVKICHGTFERPRVLGRFDVVISNPPYIAPGDKRVNRAALHDPQSALFADENGLAAYRQIAKTARDLLLPGGKIYLEIGVGMGMEVRAIFERAGYDFVGAKNDLASIERVLIFELI